MFEDLEDSAVNNELVSRQVSDSVHALHVMIRRHLSVAVPQAFLSSGAK